MKISRSTISILTTIFFFVTIISFNWTLIISKYFSTIIFASFFLIYSLLNLKTFYLTKFFFYSSIVYLILIIFLLLNKDNGVIFENTTMFFSSGSKINLLECLSLFFIIFNIGYFYSLQTDNALKYFSKIIFFQIIIFSTYILWQSSQTENQIALSLSTLILSTAPYLLVAFGNKSENKKIIIFFFILFFLIISSRAAFLSSIIFFLNYKFYPFFKKKPFLFKSIFFINLLIIFFIWLFIYKIGNNNFLNEFSLKFFNKQFESGRYVIWIDLIELIKTKPLMGFGSDQSSTFISFTSKIGIIRSLSSHNSYLELLLAGGIVALVIYLTLIFLIWLQLIDTRENYWSRIGSSYLFAMLCNSIFTTTIISGNLLIGSLTWFFLGVSIGQIANSNKKQLS